MWPWPVVGRLSRVDRHFIVLPSPSSNMLMDVDFDDAPNRCTTLVYYAWKIFTCLFLHVLLVTMVVLYCLLGAFTFQKLESEHELEVSFIVTTCPLVEAGSRPFPGPPPPTNLQTLKYRSPRPTCFVIIGRDRVIAKIPLYNRQAYCRLYLARSGPVSYRLGISETDNSYSG